MSLLSIVEHKSPKYGPRTWHNAKTADLTAAIAVDYETFGEKLTKKAAGERFIELPYLDDSLISARRLFSACRFWNVAILNIAGNGIATYAKHGIYADMVNQKVFDILRMVHRHWPIAKILSGGQTGADIAAGIAAYRLGIDVEMMFPKGFRQRFEDGTDHLRTEKEIRDWVLYSAQKLQEPES